MGSPNDEVSPDLRVLERATVRALAMIFDHPLGIASLALAWMAAAGCGDTHPGTADMAPMDMTLDLSYDVRCVCACAVPTSAGGCKNVCDEIANGTDIPDFCNGVLASQSCQICLLDRCSFSSANTMQVAVCPVSP